MRLSKVYVRFFRSFNYDFARKVGGKAKAQPWELIDGAWFPFIQVDLDREVTAVVGANESGKSHLIGAIECALTGEKIRRRDFCRYSDRYSVEQGKVRVPDFGIELELRGEEDAAHLAGLELTAGRDHTFRLFRLGEGRSVFVGEGDPQDLESSVVERLQERFPTPFRLDTQIALPQNLSFDVLLDREVGRLTERRRRGEFVDLVQGLENAETETLSAAAAQMATVLASPDARALDPEQAAAEQRLALRLLFDVAKIDKETLGDLEKALREEEDGEVDGLLEEMNRALARHLNFSRWWRQDREFELRLSSRERELAFTIRDRTGRNYSFEERSKGLKFFLSYYIQLRAHEQDAGGLPEILLMDEPDAYLSNMGQQDLLRTLEGFAQPESGGREDQVVYVTHSPFLINKNAAERIRVLAKGSEEEGTVVVRDVSRNRYEPLRSALGSFVAETAFIGGANLFVEGISDQVLLAGMTRVLLGKKDASPSRLLDLNEVTIVPAGGADGVPYMAFLARGRDELRPPAVALLDGDPAGREARKMFERGGGSRRRFLDMRYVVDLGEWAAGADLQIAEGLKVREPEDLMPIELVAEAARRYAVRFLEAPEDQVVGFDAARVAAKVGGKGGMWGAVSGAFADHFDGAEMTKVGLAREVLHDVMAGGAAGGPAGTAALEHNFKALLGHLAELLEEATGEEMRRRVEKRSDRIVKGFLDDHPDGAKRDETDEKLREVERALEDSRGDEAVRSEILAIRREFKLAADPLRPVAEFERLRERLAGLAVKRRQAYQEAEAEPAPAAESAEPATAAKASGRRKSGARRGAKSR